MWADHLSDGYSTTAAQPRRRLSDDAPKLDASNEEFLELCERLWVLAKEEEALQTQAAEARAITNTRAGRSLARELGISRGPTACDEIADRIEFNLVKRRLLLSRVQDVGRWI